MRSKCVIFYDCHESCYLTPVLRGEAMPAHSRSIYSEADAVTDPNSPLYVVSPHQELRAVQQDGWKYIYAFSQSEQKLYQLQSKSLYEPANLFQTNPDQVGILHAQLDQRFFLPTNFAYLPLTQSSNEP